MPTYLRGLSTVSDEQSKGAENQEGTPEYVWFLEPASAKKTVMRLAARTGNAEVLPLTSATGEALTGTGADANRGECTGPCKTDVASFTGRRPGEGNILLETAGKFFLLAAARMGCCPNVVLFPEATWNEMGTMQIRVGDRESRPWWFDYMTGPYTPPPPPLTRIGPRRSVVIDSPPVRALTDGERKALLDALHRAVGE